MLHEELNYPWDFEALGSRTNRYAKLASATPFRSTFRFKMLGGYTTDFLRSWSTIFAAHYGIGLNVVGGVWGSASSEIASLDPARSDADCFICFNHPHDLRVSRDTPELDLEAMKGRFTLLAERVSSVGKGLVFVLYDMSGIVPPAAGASGSISSQISALNSHLIELSAKLANVRILDLATLRGALPDTPFYSHRNWYAFGQPFTMEASIVVGHQLAVIARGSLGQSKKVLVLDLDNTLWAGVIGDDGVANISIGEETPQGRIHADLQLFVLNLKRRGVVLAIASRNTAEIALTGFDHPGSIMRAKDFALHEIHWNSKSESLSVIASTLNVGQEALVFLDDNPAERAEVSAALPDVLVPNIGENPTDFLDALTLLDPFDNTSPLTSEDRVRAENYSIDLVRRTAAATAGSQEEFLLSLGTRVEISRAMPGNFSRAIQLINKTNQFNLTTERLTESELRDYLAKPGREVWVANIADRFGEHGLTSVLLLSRDEGHARIDNWVMSCRVFNKTAEQAIAASVVSYLLKLGIPTLRVTVIPTKKNGVIADLFGRMGFENLDVNPETGVANWSLSISLDTAAGILHYCEVSIHV
ncbi:HAD-IIIC family phosphatase [Devosia sp.]|uniref:HAD-IIIC family phosphatase n=1 Tax=Devosia sp. TaxID=1871048 RepID=UPI003F4F9DCF